MLGGPSFFRGSSSVHETNSLFGSFIVAFLVAPDLFIDVVFFVVRVLGVCVVIFCAACEFAILSAVSFNRFFKSSINSYPSFHNYSIVCLLFQLFSYAIFVFPFLIDKYKNTHRKSACFQACDYIITYLIFCVAKFSPHFRHVFR